MSLLLPVKPVTLKEALIAMLEDLATFLPTFYLIPSLNGVRPMETPPPRLFDDMVAAFFMLMLMSKSFDLAADMEPSSCPKLLDLLIEPMLIFGAMFTLYNFWALYELPEFIDMEALWEF